LAVIAAVAAVAASVAMVVALAVAEVQEEEVVDFAEVAVADGDVGRIRSGG